jgi:enoyl-CoA hydratase/carnithine racemase
MNALSQEPHDRLPATWQALRDDRSVRAIVITGAGAREFCAGMDLRDLAEQGHRPTHPEVSHHLELMPMQNDVWRRPSWRSTACAPAPDCTSSPTPRSAARS